MQNVNRIVADNQESVKNSLHNLETFTGALARNSEKIDNVMARVDGVMGKADSLMLGLNTIAGGAAGGELSAMVKSIKELADDFDKRSGALMADGRRTLGDISRAVNNFDRNPSRVIFGGEATRRRPAGRAAARGPRRRQAAGARARGERTVSILRSPSVPRRVLVRHGRTSLGVGTRLLVDSAVDHASALLVRGQRVRR